MQNAKLTGETVRLTKKNAVNNSNGTVGNTGKNAPNVPKAKNKHPNAA